MRGNTLKRSCNEGVEFTFRDFFSKMGVIIFETQCEDGFGKKTKNFLVVLASDILNNDKLYLGPKNQISKIRFTNEFESLKLWTP